MRRFLMGMAMTAIALMSPAWAQAGDQEIAVQIADGLRASGRLVDYSVGVKYQDGTAWLFGRVASADQSAQAESMARQMPYVRQVINQLEIRATRAASAGEVQQVAYPPASPDVVRFNNEPTSSGGLASLFKSSSTMTQPPKNNSRNSGSRGKIMQREDLLFGTPTATPVGYESGIDHRSFPGDPLKQSRAAGYQPGGEPQGMPGAGQVRTLAAMPAVNSMPMVHGGHYGAPIPAGQAPTLGVSHTAAYDHPHMPCHAWPSYAAYPNYAGVTYPKQYSATAWPYIGPFYPYPQVPLGWRKVTLEWDDGWWWLDFDDRAGRRRH